MDVYRYRANRSRTVFIACLAVLSVLTTTIGGQDAAQFVSVTVPEFGTGWLKLPAPEEIAELTCRLYNDPLDERDSETFTIPRNEVRNVISALSENCSTAKVATAQLEVAALTLTKTDQTQHTILVTWNGGKGPLNFTYRGVRIVQSTSAWRAAWREGVVHDGSLRLCAQLAKLRAKRD